MPDVALPSTHYLSREERRALARAGKQPAKIASAGSSCLYCLGPLANGAPVCSEECDEGWWGVVPTTDGELLVPGVRS